MNELDDLCKIIHKETGEVKFISGRVHTQIWLGKNKDWRGYSY